MNRKKLAVFCGSKAGNSEDYVRAAKMLAQGMVEREIDLVYGGGKVGLMGAIADEMLKIGGQVFGVIPQKLMDMEVGHMRIHELHIVETMHDRKAKMAQMSDAFVAMPGGIGTMEEIIEVFTWQQIGYHEKPCAFLNTSGYYDTFMTFVDEMVQKQFLPQNQKDRLIVDADPNALLDKVFKT